MLPFAQFTQVKEGMYKFARYTNIVSRVKKRYDLVNSANVFTDTTTKKQIKFV